MKIGDKVIIKANQENGTICGSEVTSGRPKIYQVRLDSGAREWFEKNEIKKSRS